jgi:hypothetical protein
MNANLSLRFQPILDADPSHPTRFEGVAYSGGVIPQYGHYGDVAIDLSSMSVSPKPVFALVNHDTNQRAGKVELRKLESSLFATGSFSLATDAGKQVSAEFSEGAPWEFSVGINADAEVFPKRSEVELNGRTLFVDTIFRNARVRELSFVPAGADPNTQVVAFERPVLTPVEQPVPSIAENFMSEDREKLTALENLNVELQSKLQVTDTLVADLSAQLSAVKQQLAVEAEKARVVEAQLQANREMARKQAVEALFAALGQELSAERAAPYLAMSDESFAAISADLKALAAPIVDPKLNLFQETAKGGMESPNVVDIGRKLFDQVAGVK